MGYDLLLDGTLNVGGSTIVVYDRLDGRPVTLVDHDAEGMKVQTTRLQRTQRNKRMS